MSDVPSFEDTKSVEEQQSEAASPSEPPSFDATTEAPPEFEETKSPQEAEHSVLPQQALGALEAAGRGASFGLTSKLETATGLTTNEDIVAREHALNPYVLAGSEALGVIGSSFIPGVGEGWLLNAAAKSIVPIAKEASVLAKTGRLALRGMIEMPGMAGGDEISDALLGQGHDAEAVASHIVSAGALGLLTGGIFGASNQALEAVQNAKLGEYLDNFAVGLGAAAEGPERIAALKEMHQSFDVPIAKGIEHGIKFYEQTSKQIGKQIARKATELASGAVGNILGGLPGAAVAMDVAKKYLDPYADKLSSKVTPSLTKKVVVPIMIKAIQIGDHAGISSALNYGTKVASGTKIVADAIDDVLNLGGKEVLHATQEQNDRLNKYIEDGGIDQQIQSLQEEQQEVPTVFAEGGEVHPQPIKSHNGVAQLYPAQNMMLTSSKARVSNYLSSLRPQHTNRFIFDKEHKDAVKERTYQDALSIANAPLSVLTHAKKGTLTQEHVQHFVGMYPEVHEHISKKLTKKMVEQKVKDGKEPPYKIKQSLSMLMGAPLDSTFTSMSIQAAQSTFMQNPQQQQSQSKTKKGTAPLSKFSKDYQTPDQSRQNRESKN